MVADVVLPNLGFGMEEGRLIAWLKKSGESVKKGQPIAEIESDKAAVELEALVDGTLGEILVPADTVVPVGTVLAHILTDSAESMSGISVSSSSNTPQTAIQNMHASPSENIADSFRATPLAKRIAADQGVILSEVRGTGAGGRITRSDVQNAASTSNGKSNGHANRVLAAPAVRKLARDQHIDLGTVRGTAENGRVTRADLEAVIAASSSHSIAAPQLVSQAGRRELTLSNMRQAIGKRLVKSAQEAPHFYVTAEVDLTPALEKLPKEIGINNLLLYLTVQTLKTLPELNATYEDGHLYTYDNVNLSMAVAVPNGLLSPVLHRADDYSLSGLAERARDLITRARDNRLRSEELSGGTFTVSNLGMIKQIERFTAIINPPQVGILAIGAAKARPFVIDGGLYVRNTTHLTLSADHRIVDGLSAARFLEAFDDHLQAYAG